MGMAMIRESILDQQWKTKVISSSPGQTGACLLKSPMVGKADTEGHRSVSTKCYHTHISVC